LQCAKCAFGRQILPNTAKMLVNFFLTYTNQAVFIYRWQLQKEKLLILGIILYIVT
jgi:hypothetical protein